jgi:hypothetical protein
MFAHRLRFDLAAVLQLVDHAIASPAHDAPCGDEPAGPALLLVADPVADQAAYLASNGQPPLPPAGGPPGVAGMRVVFAEIPDPASSAPHRVHAAGAGEQWRVGLPLREPPHRPLIDQLHARADHGHDTLILIPDRGQISIASGRRRHRRPRLSPAA